MTPNNKDTSGASRRASTDAQQTIVRCIGGCGAGVDMAVYPDFPLHKDGSYDCGCRKRAAQEADALDAQRYRALRALVTNRADWPEPIRNHLTSNGVLREDAVSETKIDAAVDALIATASHKDT